MTEERSRPSHGEDEENAVQLAAEGRGPLWQRDYIGVIEGSDWPPERVMELIRADFPLFSPEAFAKFIRHGDTSQPLQKGEEMEVNIRGTGWHRVVAVRVEPRSLTLRTIHGHPEAGRVTFGAYHDEEGRLVFRIRSRARINNFFNLVAYLVMGKAIQKHIWCSFIRKVAGAVGGRVRDNRIETATHKVADSLPDRDEVDVPTFLTPADGPPGPRRRAPGR